jgi:hypothetical protein
MLKGEKKKKLGSLVNLTTIDIRLRQSHEKKTQEKKLENHFLINQIRT